VNGRNQFLVLVACFCSGCLSILAPAVDTGVRGHGGLTERALPGQCLSCHPSAAAKPDNSTPPAPFEHTRRAAAADLPTPGTAPLATAPWVPTWMLQEEGGACLSCHGID
jgi:hypothetical protein